MVENNPEKLVQGTLDQELERVGNLNFQKTSELSVGKPPTVVIEESDPSIHDTYRRIALEQLDQKLAKREANKRVNDAARKRAAVDGQVAARGSKRGAIQLARYRKALSNS